MNIGGEDHSVMQIAFPFIAIAAVTIGLMAFGATTVLFVWNTEQQEEISKLKSNANNQQEFNNELKKQNQILNEALKKMRQLHQE
jgi:hypothetical protein